MDWGQLFTNLSAFTVGSGLLAWLIRSLFKIYINKDLENFKHQLKKEQIKFLSLNNKRADVIEKLYLLLVDFEKSMKSLVSPFQPVGEMPVKEKAVVAGKAGQMFVDYYMKKKIFFSKDIVELLNCLELEFLNAWRDFTTYPIIDAGEVEIGAHKHDKLKLWNQAWQKITRDIPLSKTKLEDEFRLILGVSP